jgi:hypothetical protein
VSIKNTISLTYTLVILVALIWVPLITLHGYREWWAVVFYAVAACAVIGGMISRHLSPGAPTK